MNKCRQCGMTVPVYAADYDAGSLGVLKRAGERRGSHWMAGHDPDKHFCTMRCAALFAIEVVPMIPREAT